MRSSVPVAVVWCALAATPAWAVYSDDRLIDHVKQAVIAHHLLDHPDCVDYVITRKVQPGIDEVTLRNHGGDLPGGVKCGGDPEMGMRLFDVLVDRSNGQVATDAADPSEPFPDGFKMLK